MELKKAVVITAFGTAGKEARENSLGILQKETEKMLPEALVLTVITSPFVRKAIKEQGESVLSFEDAIDILKGKGIEDVVIQPSYLMEGIEYLRMKKEALRLKSDFKNIVMGETLTSGNSCRNLAEAIKNDIIFRPDKVYVLAGHGSDSDANKIYFDLEDEYRLMGNENVLVGTLENTPNLSDVLNKLKAKNKKDVVLIPLLSIAGAHADKDIFGRENSYLSALKEIGYNVECVCKGLAEFKGVRNIWLSSIKKAFEALF